MNKAITNIFLNERYTVLSFQRVLSSKKWFKNGRYCRVELKLTQKRQDEFR